MQQIRGWNCSRVSWISSIYWCSCVKCVTQYSWWVLCSSMMLSILEIINLSKLVIGSWCGAGGTNGSIGVVVVSGSSASSWSATPLDPAPSLSPLLYVQAPFLMNWASPKLIGPSHLFFLIFIFLNEPLLNWVSFNFSFFFNFFNLFKNRPKFHFFYYW